MDYLRGILDIIPDNGINIKAIRQLSEESISSFRIDKNAVSVFPDPVGAETSTLLLEWTSIIAYFWGVANSLNFFLNQVLTIGFKILKSSSSLFVLVL